MRNKEDLLIPDSTEARLEHWGQRRVCQRSGARKSEWKEYVVRPEGAVHFPATVSYTLSECLADLMDAAGASPLRTAPLCTSLLLKLKLSQFKCSKIRNVRYLLDYQYTYEPLLLIV